MKKIVSLILIFAAIYGWATPIMPMMQVSGPFFGPIVSASPSSSCTAPTLTNDWLPSASAGSSGKAGANDIVAANNATASSGNPVYSATGGPNSTPSLAFTAASSESLTLGTAISATWTTYSGFAVFKGTTFSSGDILGQSSPGFFWDVDNNPYMTVTMNNQTTNITDSTSHSTGTWYTEAWQWNTSTGAYNFWICSSGTCSSVASGTSTASPSANGFAYMGSYADFADFFNGSLAEVALYNGTINTTTLGHYSQCHYGI